MARQRQRRRNSDEHANQAPVAPGDLTICIADGAWARFTPDGAVDLGEKYAPESFGRAFWEGIATHNPLRAENEELRAEIARLKAARLPLTAESHE